jgi:hypothetical protein
MAINIPIITSLEDTGIKNAKAAFNDFKTAVGKAEGGIGKFKAGSKVALDAVNANAANFAVAGGIAFAKFAADGVKAFQDLALGAEKFATSTGLSIQDASRYIEAAGDIAVPVDAVEAAIGRLNKTIGADPDKVRDLGVDLVYLKDGSLDVNATFLNTIDRIKGIKDPAEKAKVAAQLLGKGWQSMSTLIEMGATDLKKSLDGVSDAKVINPEELARAKELRDVMDVLKGKVEDLSLSIGESLVPVLGDLGAVIEVGLDVRNVFKSIPGATWMSENLTPLALTKTALGGVKDAAGFVFDLFKDEKEVIPVFAEDLRNARADTDLLKEAIKQARNPLNELSTAATNASVAFFNADKAWKTLTDNLEQEVALDQAKIQLEELEAAAAKAFGSGSQADIDAYEQKALDFVTALAAISGGMDTISSKDILLRFKTQGPAAALALATFIANGRMDGKVYDSFNLEGITARANGGPVMGGSSYLVGERGAEIFTPSTSGNITPNHAMGGGGSITVNVMSADPNEVVRALQAYNRNVGKLPVKVQ